METPEKQEELQTETSFDSVKESASDVLGGLMGQIKRLEEAMKEERMGDVYQIYWNELPASIQQSSNANHEIDKQIGSRNSEDVPIYDHARCRLTDFDKLSDWQLLSRPVGAASRCYTTNY